MMISQNLKRHIHHAGFTLTELMVAVAIIGILSGIAIVASGNEWRRERVNAQAEALGGWLESVRAASLGQSSYTGCTVTFTSAVNPGDTLATVTGCTFNQSIFSLSKASTESNTTYQTSSSQSSIAFTPRGSTNTTSDVIVNIFLNNSTLLRCIKITGTLGSIRIGSNNNASSASDTCSNFGGSF